MMQPALNRYRLYKQRRGRFVLEIGQNEDFTIEIPSRIVAQFLAGNITADEVWDDNRVDINDHPNSTPSLEQDIGYFLRIAANNGQQMAKVKFVQVEPKSRDESRIRLEFGKITAPIEPINEICLRASIEPEAKDAFTLKLSTTLIICLLAGKFTADEVWKSETNQKIGDCLKKAVSKRQEIIDAKLAQVDSEFESQLQIILKFSAATNTTIREDKKR